ncbi:MAG: helix-turn-helix domain-containing protein [Gordonia paraffinivorans]
MTDDVVPTDDLETAAAFVVDQVHADLARDIAGEARLIRDVLEHEISELRGDPQLLELLGASVEGNVATFLQVVHDGVPTARLQAPAAAVDYARHLARTAAPVTALVRAYRLGYNTFMDRVYGRMTHLDVNPALRLPVFHRIHRIGSSYIDWVSETVVREYQDERERWLSHRDAQRAHRIRQILTGPDDIDSTTASAALDYGLDRTHRAVIAWATDTGVGEAHNLTREVRLHAEHCGATAAPLIVPVDDRTVWAWFPVSVDHPRGGRTPIPDGPTTPGIRLVVGAPHAGLAGFRRSHREATEARRLASLAGDDGAGTVDYTTPGVAIAAQLTVEPAVVDDWVTRVLGDLTQPTEQAERLRVTLREFLHRNGSHKATAAALHLHPNTIKYRVAAAERALGTPLSTHRLDVEVALLVTRWRRPS